jgi:HlyD family secretion protein
MFDVASLRSNADIAFEKAGMKKIATGQTARVRVETNRTDCHGIRSAPPATGVVNGTPSTLLAPAITDDARGNERVKPTAKPGDGSAATTAFDSLVGRRPPPQPRRAGRVMTLAFAGLVAVIVTALGFRYGWPRPADQFAVSRAPLRTEISGPGTLDATSKATISARVQGRITQIDVDRNDTVAPGALIARIASDDLARQLDAANAAHDAAVRAVLGADADKVRNEATLANAQAALLRKSALLTQGWATQSEYDAALAAQRQSAADLAHANAAIAGAQAQERSAAATVQMNRAQLEEAVVRAPFAGIVTSRDRNLGDFVTPGASIVQLVDPLTVVLTARFDESAIASVHPEQPVTLKFTAEPDRAITGRVLRLSRNVDTETREFTVDVTPDALPANWAIGQRGAAIITVATHDVLAVPSRDIVRRYGHAGVWLAVDGRARWRPVQLGHAGWDRVEVSAGIAAGDVVLAPQGVFPWMRVRSPGASQ